MGKCITDDMDLDLRYNVFIIENQSYTDCVRKTIQSDFHLQERNEVYSEVIFILKVIEFATK